MARSPLDPPDATTMPVGGAGAPPRLPPIGGPPPAAPRAPGQVGPGAMTAAQSGITPPPNPPGVNSAPAGAPPMGLPPTHTDQYGTTQPNHAGWTGAMPPAGGGPGGTGAVAGPGGPGGGGGKGGKPDMAAFGQGTEDKINGFLENLMSGKGTPFNPEVMGQLRGRLFGAAQGQANAAIGQANDDAVKRGMFRSGLPTDAILSARASAGQNYTKGLSDLSAQATQANSAAQQKAAEDLIQQLQNSRGYNLDVKKLKKAGGNGPDYNAQLMQLIGGMDAPSFG